MFQIVAIKQWVFCKVPPPGHSLWESPAGHQAVEDEKLQLGAERLRQDRVQLVELVGHLVVRGAEVQEAADAQPQV